MRLEVEPGTYLAGVRLPLLATRNALRTALARYGLELCDVYRPHQLTEQMRGSNVALSADDLLLATELGARADWTHLIVARCNALKSRAVELEGKPHWAWLVHRAFGVPGFRRVDGFR
jgi:hypothetical protein